MPIERRAETGAVGKEGMRRDDEAVARGPQPGQIVERPHARHRVGVEVQQQDVAAANRALDTGDQKNAALARAGGKTRVGELAVVEGDGEGVESENGGALDERFAAMGDTIQRIVGGVEMKVYFEHVSSSTEAPARFRRGISQ